MHGTVAHTRGNISTDGAAIFYPAFDYIRAAAAIGVFAAHVELHHRVPLGNACVKIFFALSGFLIGGLLLRTPTKDLPRFYFNRAARIWIPYMIAISTLFAVAILKQGWADPRFGDVLVEMTTFVYNWFGPQRIVEYGSQMPLNGTGNHFWSICVEEQFYLVAPFLVVFLNRWLSTSLLIGLVILNVYIQNDFAAVALGVLLAMHPGWRPVAIAAAFAIVSLILFEYSVWMPFVAVTIIGIAARKGTQSPIAKVIGGASYSFYLNHWLGIFAMHAAMKHGWPFPVALIVGFACAWCISLTHYLLIDLSISRYRDRFFTTNRGIACCATGIALVCAGLSFGLYRN